jgi:hypothetical protein
MLYSQPGASTAGGYGLKPYGIDFLYDIAYPDDPWLHHLGIDST